MDDTDPGTIEGLGEEDGKLQHQPQHTGKQVYKCENPRLVTQESFIWSRATARGAPYALRGTSHTSIKRRSMAAPQRKMGLAHSRQTLFVYLASYPRHLLSDANLRKLAGSFCCRGVSRVRQAGYCAGVPHSVEAAFQPHEPSTRAP